MRNPILPLFLLFFTLFAALSAAPARADVERWSSTPRGWTWLHGVTPQQVTDHINATGHRLIDLEVEDALPLTFSAAFVENTGEMAAGWWWLYGQTVASLSDFVAQNDARIIDLTRYETLGGTRYAAVMVHNSGAQAKAWWWYVGLTASQVTSNFTANGARLVDMETYVVGSTRYFDVVMIQNSGADASGWWWYYNATPSYLSSQLASTGGRILDLDPHLVNGDLRFDAVVKANPQGTAWWWYYGQTEADVTNLVNQNGARIVDVEAYWQPVGNFILKRFAVAMVNNSNELTTEMAARLGWGSNGATGAYLREVGSSSPLVWLNADYAFEPASTMKITHNFHAVREVMLGNIAWNNLIQVSQNMDGSCPLGGAPYTVQSLSQTLEDMMWFSDNAATLAIADRFGPAAIEATAQNVAGMPSAELNHTLGCGPPNGTESLKNRLTLSELGGLFEGVQTGALLTPTYREEFYDHMQSDDTPSGSQWWFTTDLRDVVFQEAANLGIPDAAPSFWANVELAWKPGGYTLCWPNCEEYRSVAGIVTLPECGRALSKNSYVFGLFIDEATGAASADTRLRETKEMFRDLVRDALQTCPTAAPDTPALASDVRLEPNFPNPFNPSTTLRFRMEKRGRVLVQIYDLRGQHVATLYDGVRDVGTYEEVWNGTDSNGRNVASGTYMVRAMTAEGHDTQKIVLAK